MALNYTDLVGAKTVDGSIKQWVNHSEVPSTTILTNAEAWIYERLRVRQMLATATGTLTADTSNSITLPTTYRGPLHLMFPGSATSAKHLPARKTIDFIRDNINYDGAGAQTVGRPQYWGTDASNILFETIVDKAYPYDFMFYSALAALSGSNLTNFLTTEYPHLLLAVCAYFSYEWLRNSQEKVYWLKVAEGEISESSKESDMELQGVDLAVAIPGDSGYGYDFGY